MDHFRASCVVYAVFVDRVDAVTELNEQLNFEKSTAL